MTVDWNILGEAAKIVGAAAAGAFALNLFERKAKLVSFFGAVSTHQVSPPDQPAFRVFTHEVVVRNVGKKRATNVRLTHHVLPDFHVFPPTQYRIEANPAGGEDLVLLAMLPGEQVVVSYLYFPPLKAGDVHAGIRHDDGFAHAIPVLIQRQWPRWLVRLASFLQVAGLIACIYVLWYGSAWVHGKLAG